MKVEYSLEGSRTLFVTEVKSGLQAYRFLRFMIDDLDECRFLTEEGPLEVGEILTRVGDKFDPLTLNLPWDTEECARRFSKALNLPVKAE